MSVPERRKRRQKRERSALQILEEAFHLIRSVDVKYLWMYFLGSVPFVAGLLVFAADMSRSSLADQTAVPAALIMAGLYFWMRFCQARFCEGLWVTLTPRGGRTLGGWDRFSNLCALFLIQAFQVPLLLAGALFVVPLGWVVAMLQNSTSLALNMNYQGRSLRGLLKSSVRHSHDEWAQNHGILIVFLFISIFAWINIVGTCVALAMFAKAFLGVESMFTISPLVAIFNSTFFLGSLFLTYLVISPVMKSAYVLRCFYAESRHTGEDLLSRLANSEARRRKSPRESSTMSGGNQAALILATLIGLSLWMSSAQAEEEASPSEFEAELSETMEQKKYQWQLSRRLNEDVMVEDESWLARRLREIAEATQAALKSVGDWFDEMMDRFEREGRRGQSDAGGNGLEGLQGLGSSLSLVLVAVVIGLIVWLLFILYRKYRGSANETEAADYIAEVVDLQSEDIVASQLPEGEWMRLAREQISKGDGRLAIRALFLATLANLGEEGIIKIARFKSNRDYRRELELKARKMAGLRGAFDENTTLFEEAWYGWHPVEDMTVDEFLKNHETIAQESGTAKASLDVLQGGGR